ncbi:MAG: DUF255 domain-containing protein [Bacteroidales bacterium]
MYKTSSPYVKELLKGEIQWRPFTKSTLDASIRENKVTFIHIGNISKTPEREAAYKLFRTRKVIDIMNKHFIPIALDTEDVPEAVLIGLDMLLINEKQISIPINAFSLPGIRPITAFSSMEAGDFLAISKNVIDSFAHKRPLLRKVSDGMMESLAGTGVITHKESPREINAKVLHTYVKSWESRIMESNTLQSPYLINTRFLIFFLKYYSRYQMYDKLLLLQERIDQLYYSSMFDPIDGGLFTRAIDSSYKEPLFEKSFSENIQASAMFSFAYKYYGSLHYKVAAERIQDFIESEFKSPHGGYMTAITLQTGIDKCTYFRYSLKELKKHFPIRYTQIALYLGMDISIDETIYQNISNTEQYWHITPDELNELKKIRKAKKEIVLDKRVITAYNCMYASSLCICARNIKEIRNDSIQRAEEIIRTTLIEQKQGKITLHRYILSGSDTYIQSDLFDYAFFLNAILLLLRSTQKEEYKTLSRKYTAYILLNFYQSCNGMFSKAAKDTQITPLKRESIMDYIRFSANSIMARNLFILSKITGDQFYMDAFKQQIYNIESQLIGSGPLMVGWALQILNLLTDKHGYEEI